MKRGLEGGGEKGESAGHRRGGGHEDEERSMKRAAELTTGR